MQAKIRRRRQILVQRNAVGEKAQQLAVERSPPAIDFVGRTPKERFTIEIEEIATRQETVTFKLPRAIAMA